MNVILRLGIIVLILYMALLALLYFFQERLIFFPSKLDQNYEFSFDQPFEEIRLDANGAWISGLKFLAQSRDGGQIYSDANGERKAKNGAVIFFHGNAGNLQGWGKYARYFTDLGYDFYLFDYRGYGKSGGEISSQKQLYADADAMMEPVLREYDAGEVAALGYSVGSGLAARAAQKYGAKRLVLIAPYFSLEDLAREKMPFVPKFLIKYKIPTFEFVGDFGGPVTIFHGEHDELIGVDNSRRLLKFLKPGDKIYELNAGHNDILGLGELWGKLGEKLGE
ncbi:alpha/beta fold hydrolase [Campylobacter showae]|uniref:alpha/beta hydrolase n=1 Tax=Campylobacter showae TaxID=204 RepID=UPI0028D617D3|nr:alpha/beta fold hydrolase [Campylobacter showae]